MSKQLGTKRLKLITNSELESRKSQQAQVQPSDLWKTDKWQEIAEDQECQADAKQKKANKKSHQL
jgi:hypothetical protein